MRLSIASPGQQRMMRSSPLNWVVGVSDALFYFRTYAVYLEGYAVKSPQLRCVHLTSPWASGFEWI